MDFDAGETERECVEGSGILATFRNRRKQESAEVQIFFLKEKVCVSSRSTGRESIMTDVPCWSMMAS